MHNLPCFIISPISAGEDDEWLWVLIELNIDLCVCLPELIRNPSDGYHPADSALVLV